MILKKKKYCPKVGSRLDCPVSVCFFMVQFNKLLGLGMVLERLKQLSGVLRARPHGEKAI